MMSKPVPPSVRTSRLALSGLALLCAATTVIAVRVPLDTGSVAADQAALLLRVALFILGVWLSGAIAVSIWEVRRTGAHRMGEPSGSRPTERLASRVAPRWIRELARRAVGTVAAVAVVSSTVSVASASMVSAPASMVAPVVATAPPPPGPPTATQRLHPAPVSAVVVDPSSGQQWPVIVRQAESTAQHPPQTGVRRFPVAPVAPITASTVVSPPRPMTLGPAPALPRTIGPPTVGPAIPPTRPTNVRDRPEVRNPTTTHAVIPGESFWSIAETRVLTVRPRADDGAIAAYWRLLIGANVDTIPVAGNPDLLYPGTVLIVPDYPEISHRR